MTESERGPSPPSGEGPLYNDTGAVNAPAGGPVLSIDNVATMFSVSPLMLRYYEFRGLIRRRHLIGSTRVYSWADCDRIAFILKCQRAGLRLAEVKPIVKAVDDDSSALFSEAAQERCMELVERLERCKKVCDEALAELVHTHSLLSARTGSDQLAQKP